MRTPRIASILMRTHDISSYSRKSRKYPYYSSLFFLTLIRSNYPYLEHIFMMLKIFEPLKFYYTCNLPVFPTPGQPRRTILQEFVSLSKAYCLARVPFMLTFVPFMAIERGPFIFLAIHRVYLALFRCISSHFVIVDISTLCIFMAF